MHRARMGGWALYIATGIGFIALALLSGDPLWMLPIALIAAGYFAGLIKQMRNAAPPGNTSRNEILLTMAIAIAAASATWFINHELGYGALVASGLIGVIAGVTLPHHLAGAAYAASFVGMSANAVLPTMTTAWVAGAIAGIIIVSTGPVFGGIGGKGGTAAAAAVLITSALIFTVGA